MIILFLLLVTHLLYTYKFCGIFHFPKTQKNKSIKQILF